LSEPFFGLEIQKFLRVFSWIFRRRPNNRQIPETQRKSRNSQTAQKVAFSKPRKIKGTRANRSMKNSQKMSKNVPQIGVKNRYNLGMPTGGTNRERVRKMKQATMDNDKKVPVYSLIGVAQAFEAPISIHIYEGASWKVESEHIDPWLNQHGCFYVAETICDNLPSWDTSDPTILKKQILSVLEHITNEDGTLKGAN
jgi:hypothetical protein